MKVFELLVYAIAAVVLVALFFSIISFFFPALDNSKIISDSLATASLEINRGSIVHVGYLDFPKGSSLSSSDFKGDFSSVSFECVSANDCCPRESDLQGEKCTKNFLWDYSFFSSADSGKVNVYSRCVSVNEALFCKVFFGAKPAQALIESAEYTGVDSSANQTFTVTVRNNGSLPIAFGTNSISLLKKAYGEWEPTDFSAESKEVESIAPGEKHVFFWSINPINLGEYKAVFRFESQNSGFSEKSVEFKKELGGECLVLGAGETIFDPESNEYRELRSCTGCNYAFECVLAWSQANSSVEFFPYTKEFAYCVKSHPDGSC